MTLKTALKLLLIVSAFSALVCEAYYIGKRSHPVPTRAPTGGLATQSLVGNDRRNRIEDQHEGLEEGSGSGSGYGSGSGSEEPSEIMSGSGDQRVHSAVGDPLGRIGSGDQLDTGEGSSSESGDHESGSG